ncbi:MAG: hypothetical protein RLZZ129_1765 [Verrucomicrobiota bacterium]
MRPVSSTGVDVEPCHPMMRLILLLLPALVTGCARPGPAPVASAPAASVRVAVTTTETVAQIRPVAGTVRPQDRAVVAARVMGLVTQSKLAVGRPVATGELLVTLEAGEISARLAQARATLQQAERDFARERSLEAQGATPAESVRSAADRLQLAQAAVAEAETLLSYTRITAPFAGVITADFVKPGDLTAPGQPLFALEGTGRLQAEAAVPDSLPALAPGVAVNVMLDGITLAGRLAEISPSADIASRSRLVRIDLPADAAARSGQFVRVLWPAGDETLILAPAGAVSVLGQMERVFVVADGRAQLRLVKTGGSREGRTVILAGLEAGETVVLDPPPALRDGQTVELRP